MHAPFCCENSTNPDPWRSYLTPSCKNISSKLFFWSCTSYILLIGMASWRTWTSSQDPKLIIMLLQPLPCGREYHPWLMMGCMEVVSTRIGRTDQQWWPKWWHDFPIMHPAAMCSLSKRRPSWWCWILDWILIPHYLDQRKHFKLTQLPFAL